MTLIISGEKIIGADTYAFTWVQLQQYVCLACDAYEWRRCS